jgi:glycosyltransferase involved in cell wall biosynthesis
MQDVVQALPSARLTLAGFHDDRVYEDELRQLAERLGLKAAIGFRFGISEDEKRALLDSALALVLPSTVEGFGIVVLEANSRRVPVIASTGVPRGAVEDDRNGLRYQFADIPALSRAMIRIASDDALRTRLADQSHTFAQEFEFTKVCREYELVLLEAVARRRLHVARIGDSSGLED